MVDPLGSVSRADVVVARQLEGRDHLDGPPHEMGRRFGEDPGRRTGGRRGGNREQNRRLAGDGYGRDSQADPGRAPPPRSRLGRPPVQEAAGARRRGGGRRSGLAGGGGEGGGGGRSAITRTSSTNRAKVAMSSPTASPRSACSMAASNWTLGGMSGKRSSRGVIGARRPARGEARSRRSRAAATP